MGVGDTLEYFDPLVLEHFDKCVGLVFSTSIRHPLANSCFVLVLHHCKELLSGSDCSILRAQIYSPCMGGGII